MAGVSPNSDLQTGTYRLPLSLWESSEAPATHLQNGHLQSRESLVLCLKIVTDLGVASESTLASPTSVFILSDVITELPSRFDGSRLPFY